MEIDKRIEDLLREVLTLAIKERLDDRVWPKVITLAKELQGLINKTADIAATQFLDEARVEEIARAVKEGATSPVVDGSSLYCLTHPLPDSL